MTLVQLAIIVGGAGLVGAVISKEGHMPSMSDVITCANKVLERIRINKEVMKSQEPIPVGVQMELQVERLRQDLRQLTFNERPVTIVTTNGSRGGKYGIVIVFVVVGFGYVWWKGWKLVDMMFATKHSLSDAKTAVSKQLENVFSSLPATKRRSLSSTTDSSVNSSFYEVPEITASLQEEVSSQVPEKSYPKDDTHIGVTKLTSLPPVPLEELPASHVVFFFFFFFYIYFTRF
ncbi:uncharacterized protein [Rutidosis leptorrhynchoides]|uniref:uncharacterized protein n=1 Tax=Rutidosis leptorrhynchoides TaxID=125765 RepID=UPI003A9A1622